MDSTAGSDSEAAGSTAGAAGAAAGAAADSIALVACTRLPQQQGVPSRFMVTVPRIDAYFTGTGGAHQHQRPISISAAGPAAQIQP
jgi:hypothetical protein